MTVKEGEIVDKHRLRQVGRATLETEGVTGLKLTGFKGEAAHPERDKAIVAL